MTALVARCGYRCDLCPAYKANVRTVDDQQKVCDGWFKYYGFRIPPERIPCDGCLADDSENPRRIDTACPVRPCVIGRNLENCAYCEQCPCKNLETRLVEYETIARKFGSPIPPEDRASFIEPYEARKRLQSIRAGLRGKARQGDN